MLSTMDQLDSLRAVLRGYGSCVVAYSGGVDSVLLAKVAYEELGDRMLAAIADSPSLPRRELAEAQSIAEEFGFPLEILNTEEFANADYSGNPVNRCYFCKHELFSHLKPLARARGFEVIVYGENTSDVGDWRPGAVAAEEFDVRAPLKEAGLSKDAIRSASRALGLPTAEKPAMPCLSSRIPYGEPVTREKVAMIEQAEYVLRDLGFAEVRVRHHEFEGPDESGPCARIEMGAEEMEQLQDETFAEIQASLRRVGYAEVEVDARGYRRGSLNPVKLSENQSVNRATH